MWLMCNLQRASVCALIVAYCRANESWSTGVGVGEPMAAGVTSVFALIQTESLEFDWGSHASGEEVSIQVDDTLLEVQEVGHITPAVALTELVSI